MVARRSDTIAPSMNGMLMRVIRAACAVSINAVMTNMPSSAPTTRPRMSTAAREQSGEAGGTRSALGAIVDGGGDPGSWFASRAWFNAPRLGNTLEI